MSLKDYGRKRDFTKTPEPRPRPKRNAPPSKSQKRPVFVVQRHDATNLHYDLRLQVGTALASWAVPKGPSMNPADKRLAVHVEDHPLDYGGFEGVIPEGYGAGTVMVWDRGHWESESGDPAAAIRDGMLKFRLEGERLKGRWMLVRTKPQTARQEHWLLVKERDALASPGFTTEAFMTSVASGRTMAEIASGQTARRRATSKPSAELDVATIAGARRSTMPASLRPQLAVTESAPPEGDQWVHEAKFDGYRLLAFKRGDDVRLISRTGKDWTARFKTVAETIRARVPVDAVLDGEAVVLDAQGVSNFQALQNAIVGRRNGSIVYFAFDLIWCDGFDLTRAGLLRRKEALLALIGPRQEGKLRYSEHAAVSGRAALAHARQNGLEGIVSKKITAAYSQTRTSSWVKSKCFSQQEFVVGGFTPPEGTREKFGALIIGYYDASSSWTTTGS